MPAISITDLSTATAAVERLTTATRQVLVTEIQRRQPFLLSSVLDLRQRGCQWPVVEELMVVLFIAYLGMKNSGFHWPVITPDVQARCMEDRVAELNGMERLSADLFEQAVLHTVSRCREPNLFAIVLERLRERGLIGDETEAQANLLMAAYNLVDCIDATAPRLPRVQRETVPG